MRLKWVCLKKPAGANIFLKACSESLQNLCVFYDGNVLQSKPLASSWVRSHSHEKVQKKILIVNLKFDKTNWPLFYLLFRNQEKICCLHGQATTWKCFILSVVFGLCFESREGWLWSFHSPCKGAVSRGEWLLNCSLAPIHLSQQMSWLLLHLDCSPEMLIWSLHALLREVAWENALKGLQKSSVRSDLVGSQSLQHHLNPRPF